MSNSSKIYPVILAGGSGTRLWPLSRALSPKQLISLGGEDTLLQQTIERAYMLSDKTPIIITNKSIYDQINLGKLTKTAEFVLEPSAKNTAPAIALAASDVYKKDPEGVVVVLSADHHIDEKNFVPYLKKAVEAANESSKIILIGIKPTRPETGYGYIKSGARIDDAAFEIDVFAEKPELEKAKEHLASGNYYWNAGIFVARADVFKKEIEEHLPELKSLFSGASAEDVYGQIKAVSIDQGLMEKTGNIAVVPADASWSDLGSWGAIYDISDLDSEKNCFEGNVVSKDVKGSLILGRGGRRIAAIGLEDVVVVDTEDVTLVCDRHKTQDVKHIVDQIKAEPNNKDSIEHKTMHRPWGRYTVLDEGEGFKVKFIHVIPEAKLSLQSHNKRSEHWVVVKGHAKMTIGETEKILGPNESIYVPLGVKHRLENVGDKELTIVEVATGNYIEEDDIVRYEDIYNRG